MCFRTFILLTFIRALGMPILSGGGGGGGQKKKKKNYGFKKR
jgi:hypothetical protein